MNEEIDSVKGYREALQNIYRNKSDMMFLQSSFIQQLDVFRTVFESTTEDIIMCCPSLDTAMFNNDLFLESLKKFLSGGNTFTVIVNEDKISEDILKLYKGYNTGMQIYMANDDFVKTCQGFYKEAYEHEIMFVCGKSYIKKILNRESDSNTIIACYNDSSESKKIKKLFNEFLPKLDKINHLTGNKITIPTIDEILHKFRGIGIEEQIIRDIVEFTQGKTE